MTGLVCFASYRNQCNNFIPFHTSSDYGIYNIFVDKVVVDNVPACISPTNLAVANVTNNTADLSWTDNTSGAATYIVEWRETGTTTWNSATTAAGDTSYQITGLNDNTEYEWQLTADCWLIGRITIQLPRLGRVLKL